MPKRVLRGKVVARSGDKTVSVRVERRIMHPVYKKYIARSKKYAAHDADNICVVGDDVRIQETRPLSKRKSWIVLTDEPSAVERGAAS